ncbi:hypothetical protein ADL30_00775 [Streptomyces sp. NRRL S-1521]|nr:hypothetical protein [Streptomyces sp. NRRL S-1521]KUL64028.1 hypothetical protein ADL30_00775 [Streptomyces sp. NRRL S-1521]
MEEAGAQLVEAVRPGAVEDDRCQVGGLVVLGEERGDEARHAAVAGRTLLGQEPEQLRQAVAAGGEGEHPYHVGESALVLPHQLGGGLVLVGQP